MTSRLLAAAVTAVGVVVASTFGGPPARAADDHTITLTFVRHAESAANASGVIDTSTPGPDITDEGRGQAEAVAVNLSANHYDGIFASSMVRTQETAAPMAQKLGEPVAVLPGLREIEAGQYEGQPKANSATTFLAAPLQWLRGNRAARIPGSIDGNEFDARFDDAVQQIYDSGDVNPVAFSHGEAIMFWVMMNVHNPEPPLVTTQPLPNTGYVVITGSPKDGWTLTDWDGTAVSR